MTSFDKYILSPTQLNEEDKMSLEKIMEGFPYFLLAKIIYAKKFLNPPHTEEEKQLFKHIVSLCYDKSIFYQTVDRSIEFQIPIETNISPTRYECTKYHSELKEIFDDLIYFQDKNKISRYDDGFEWNPQPMKDEKRIIERFISSEPKIIINPDKEKKYEEPEKRVKKSQKEYEEMITESLAKLHAKQGNHTKAIAMYKRLQLKYPEKFSYFATRMELLKVGM